MSETIFAVATAKGKSGVAVIRLSGGSAFEIAHTFVGEFPRGGKALRWFSTADGDAIDQLLVVSFPKGASFTGDPVVEFQCHGSIAVTNAILDALAADGRARLAEPGEFTRRALYTGALDVSQVEGLADLIDAETEVQRRQAVHLLSGTLSDRVQEWRKQLIRAASLLEAVIDFADEDIPTDVTPEVTDCLQSVRSSLISEIEGSYVAERIRDGFEVAIIGPPNIGKSTLLNYLAGRDAALISDIAGTTRDIIEVRMDLQGLPVTVLDTAGQREAQDEIEALGIERARKRAEEADIRVFMTETGSLDALEALYRPEDIVVVGKADQSVQGSDMGVSGLTGAGIAALTDQIASVLSKRASMVQTSTQARHRQALQSAAAHIDKAVAELDIMELAAAEIRLALTDLNFLVGAVDVESLLDEIFASFCLGK